ncbi:DUF6461 domain-containing protein [Nonomuraea fuscirosea]|jgi:hypothetical protein|uniref:DUF6461 domain-containing protein n=1 Tax=Nonomuraea fuscirosea TaxID=1291556 RepID=UPI002DD8F08D|nr:DUF6461 domain-containing protein [Nonomuraea fuscirosea]WSA55707.1 DUF6461 domain-containing protein [Nonomuraea fuscirosea]
MIATAADYAWFTFRRFTYDEYTDLREAYCFTLVRGLTPEQVITRTGAEAGDFPPMGLKELIRTAFSSSVRPDSGYGHFFGVVAVDDWAFIVEPNGFMGVCPDIAGRLSAGTLLVSHFLNVNGVEDFLCMEDGRERMALESSSPDADSSIRSAEEFDEIARLVGFDLAHSSESFLAMAEYLTGVKVTPELLEQSLYLCGVAPPSP